MLRARAQAPARAQSRSPSTRQGRSRDATLTRAAAIHAIRAHRGRRNHHVRRSGRGDRPRQGTRPFSINPAGTSAGYYNDASGVFHGFLRTPDGVITTFDIPGAGTGPGQVTFAGNINPAEAIAGRYVDASDVAHGFLRARTAPSLRLMLRTPAQAPARAPLFLPAFASTPPGRSRQLPLDASDVYHGVLRAPDGTITTFDVPGAGTGPFQGTLPLGINQAGTIEGDYIDSE